MGGVGLAKLVLVTSLVIWNIRHIPDAVFTSVIGTNSPASEVSHQIDHSCWLRMLLSSRHAVLVWIVTGSQPDSLLVWTLAAVCFTLFTATVGRVIKLLAAV